MLSVFIDGKRYKESFVRLEKSFLFMTHRFKVCYPLDLDTPFTLGSLIEVKIGGKRVAKGVVRKIAIRKGMLEVYGENEIASKLDSYPKDFINFNEALTLDKIIQKLLGIEPIVKNISEPFEKEELIIDDNCKTYSEYISRLASKKALFIIEDGDGNLVITRNNETEILGSFGDGENIKETNFCFDSNELYENIILYAQSNINSYLQDSTEIPLEKIEGIKKEAKDPSILDGRTLFCHLNYGITEPDLQRLTNFQIGLQRAKALKYKVEYPYFLLEEGNPIDIGKLVKINSKSDNIRGTFFIEEVIMESGVEFLGGKPKDFSTLVLTYENSYKEKFSLGNNTNMVGGVINV